MTELEQENKGSPLCPMSCPKDGALTADEYPLSLVPALKPKRTTVNKLSTYMNLTEHTYDLLMLCATITAVRP